MDDIDDRIDDEWVDEYDPETDCPRCKGSGRVPTEDYESYFGAMYKPCPVCFGHDCGDQPPRS